MPAALPVELRERIVGASHQGMAFAEIARVFRVGRTTVRRYVAMAAEGQSLEPRLPPGARPKLGPSAMEWLKKNIEANPFVTSYELSALFNRTHRRQRVHRSTILRAMHKLGFTFKKNRS